METRVLSELAFQKDARGLGEFGVIERQKASGSTHAFILAQEFVRYIPDSKEVWRIVL